MHPTTKPAELQDLGNRQASHPNHKHVLDTEILFDGIADHSGINLPCGPLLHSSFQNPNLQIAISQYLISQLLDATLERMAVREIDYDSGTIVCRPLIKLQFWWSTQIVEMGENAPPIEISRYCHC